MRIKVVTSLWGCQGEEGTVVETLGFDWKGDPFHRVRLDSGASLPPLLTHEIEVLNN